MRKKAVRNAVARRLGGDWKTKYRVRARRCRGRCEVVIRERPRFASGIARILGRDPRQRTTVIVGGRTWRQVANRAGVPASEVRR